MGLPPARQTSPALHMTSSSAFLPRFKDQVSGVAFLRFHLQSSLFLFSITYPVKLLLDGGHNLYYLICLFSSLSSVSLYQVSVQKVETTVGSLSHQSLRRELSVYKMLGGVKGVVLGWGAGTDP